MPTAEADDGLELEEEGGERERLDVDDDDGGRGVARPRTERIGRGRSTQSLLSCTGRIGECCSKLCLAIYKKVVKIYFEQFRSLNVFTQRGHSKQTSL